MILGLVGTVLRFLRAGIRPAIGDAVAVHHDHRHPLRGSVPANVSIIALWPFGRAVSDFGRRGEVVAVVPARPGW